MELGRPFGMTENDFLTKDGHANLAAARALKRVHNLRIEFSGKEQGADGWLIHGGAREELEMKSSRKERFLFTKRQDESEELAVRLARSSFLFISMAGMQLSEVYLLQAPNPINEYFRARADILRGGGPQLARQYSLKQVKEMGARKLI